MNFLAGIIAKLIAAIRGNQTLDDIVGAFNKTAKRLDAFVERQDRAVTDLAAEIAAKSAARTDAAAQADRGRRTKAKLVELTR